MLQAATFALNYTPRMLENVFEVGHDGVPIPGSPFKFEVTEVGLETDSPIGTPIHE